MALIMDVTKSSGVVISRSYIKVELVSGSKETCRMTVNYYGNQTLYTDGKDVDFQEYIEFTPSVADDSPNFIKQGYEYLKTLPKFSTAIDA